MGESHPCVGFRFDENQSFSGGSLSSSHFGFAGNRDDKAYMVDHNLTLVE